MDDDLNFNPTTICRCCLAEHAAMKTIFCREIINSSVVPFAGVFENVIGFKIQPGDRFPQQVCPPCRQTIIDAYMLRQKSTSNRLLLANILNIELERDTAVQIRKVYASASTQTASHAERSGRILAASTPMAAAASKRSSRGGHPSAAAMVTKPEPTENESQELELEPHGEIMIVEGGWFGALLNQKEPKPSTSAAAAAAVDTLADISSFGDDTAVASRSPSLVKREGRTPKPTTTTINRRRHDSDSSDDGSAASMWSEKGGTDDEDYSPTPTASKRRRSNAPSSSVASSASRSMAATSSGGRTAAAAGTSSAGVDWSKPTGQLGRRLRDVMMKMQRAEQQIVQLEEHVNTQIAAMPGGV